MSKFVLLAAALSVSGAVANYLPHFTPCTSEFTPYVYVNCFNDPAGDVLPFNPGIDGQNMTTEYCQAGCKANGFRYAGLEYYGQCRCGAAINGTANIPTGNPSDTCSYACTGAPDEICGGSNLISVYQDPTYPPFDATTAGTQYSALGCYNEIEGRALMSPQDQIFGSGMTVELCLNTCGTQGYAFAAVEYSEECYCGGILATNSLPADSSNCNMPCDGNSAETCGGSDFLNLYYNKNLDTDQVCGASAVSSGVPLATSASGSYTVPTSSAIQTLVTTSTPVSSAIVYTTPVSSAPTTSSPASSAPATSSPASSATVAASATGSSTYSSSSCTTTAGHSTTPTVPATPVTSSKTATTSIACHITCGKYCAPPLPQFTDVFSCANTVATCWAQTNDCWASNAGLTSVSTCVNLAAKCANYNAYCKTSKCSTSSNNSGCSNSDCDNGGFKPTTTKATSIPKPTYHPAPAPSATPTTGVCMIPSAYSSAVGGYKAPIVSCNDEESSFLSGNPFKCFSSVKTSIAASYARSSVATACQDSCLQQYENCRNQYASTCTSPRLARRFLPDTPADKRTLSFLSWLWPWLNAGSSSTTDSYNTALSKCSAQQTACLTANSKLTAANSCKHFAAPVCAPGW